MECPRCDVESLDDIECHACGIVFAKWAQREASQRAAAEETRLAAASARRAVSRLYRPSRGALMESFTCLSRFIQTGTTLLEALDFLAGAQRTGLERVYADLALRVREGENLVQAASYYPQVFSRRLTAELAAGEEIGQLAPVFERAVARMELSHKLSRVLMRKLGYLGLLFALWAVVSPLPAAFIGGGGGYPLAAGMRLGVVFLVFVGAPWLLVRALRVPALSAGMRWLAWRGLWPFSVYVTYIRHVFMDGLAAHLAAGFSALRALKSVAESTADAGVSRALGAAVDGGALETSLSVTLTQSRLARPADGLQILSAEKTGTLVESLARLAIFYRERFERRLWHLTSVANVLVTLLVFGAIAWEIYATYAGIQNSTNAAMELLQQELKGIWVR